MGLSCLTLIIGRCSRDYRELRFKNTITPLPYVQVLAGTYAPAIGALQADHAVRLAQSRCLSAALLCCSATDFHCLSLPSRDLQPRFDRLCVITVFVGMGTWLDPARQSCQHAGSRRRDCHFADTHFLAIPIETPTEGRGGCS